ncbi:protein of unknown function [Pseudorhizobium banfieldiae]|uniref:Uncharacterized protein n=1 Tax=Pseudorhizobium banfieldiae TaxID=1125847 RepID=L0NGJ8_9HYPH|nr:protein of unknown function [Pseudorhizobium banfieldiae]
MFTDGVGSLKNASGTKVRQSLGAIGPPRDSAHQGTEVDFLAHAALVKLDKIGRDILGFHAGLLEPPPLTDKVQNAFQKLQFSGLQGPEVRLIISHVASVALPV